MKGKIKNIFFSTLPRKIMSTIILVIISLAVTLTIIVNVTATPMALFARSTLFAGDANATPFSNYNEIKKGVEVIKDISYGKKEKNTFDVYLPKDEEVAKNKPTLIWVHGGGFVGGDKDMLKYYATTLASDGYKVLAINYDLAPEEVYPTPILQLTDFVKYLENDKKLDIDMNNLVLVGDSAGAQIVAQFAIIQTNKQYADKYEFEGVLKPGSIKGMLLYCGPYDFREFASADSPIIRFIFSQIGWSYFGEKNWVTSLTSLEASVLSNVDKNFPSSYITDGNTASFQKMGEALVSKLDTFGVKNQSRFFDEKQYGALAHEFQFVMNTEAGEIIYNDTLRFLKSIQK